MCSKPFSFGMLLLLLVVPLFAFSGMGLFESVLPSPLAAFFDSVQRPLALVYRGPAGCPRCSEAVAALLESSKWDFDVKYVGPKESLHLSATLLKTATLYAQPGGNGSLDTAYALLQSDAPLIRAFVKSGGHYLGFCMGGYLAGATPGFKLLPGDTGEFITTRGASVRTTANTTIKVYWRGQPHMLFFQDGPYFILNHKATNVTVLARYANGEIAALVTPYGQGRVGVVGPHPEAMGDWYRVHHLAVPETLHLDLGYDLIDTVMR
jgi:glutamine amidotransferase-like uncharacterized protein